jgi:hypothetical protein
MPKPKGSPKTGGRKKGTPNKITQGFTERAFPEERLKKLWEFHLKNEVPSMRYRTFEMVNHYLFGKPVMPISGAEDVPPVHIDISAIPHRFKQVDSVDHTRE